MTGGGRGVEAQEDREKLIKGVKRRKIEIGRQKQGRMRGHRVIRLSQGSQVLNQRGVEQPPLERAFSIYSRGLERITSKLVSESVERIDNGGENLSWTLKSVKKFTDSSSIVRTPQIT